MRNQRGLGLIELAIWGVALAALAAAAYSAWKGFEEHIAAPYVAEQIRQDQAVINTANSERDAAKAEAKGARTDLESIKLQAGEQTKALRTAEALAATAQAAARQAGIAYATEVAKHATRISELARRATSPADGGRACADVLASVDAILRDSAKIMLGFR